MRKFALYTIFILFVSCRFRKDREYVAKIDQLPTFQIISLDSSRFIDTKTLAAGKALIFFYFDPDCEHCQKETKTILTHIDRLSNVQIYLVTNGLDSSVKTFCKKLRPDTLENVMIGRDYQYSFYRAFVPPTVPYVAIYNSRKKLTKVYIGETNINYVINAAQNNNYGQ